MKPLPLLAFAAVVTACGTSGTPATSQVAGSIGTPTTLATPAGDVGTVVRVFDGDSFEANVSGTVVEVRMLGINTPEENECHGDAAQRRLRELLEGAEITLVRSGEDDTDRFGRLLRSVYADGAFVNATMVAEGHAIALQGGDPVEAMLVELTDTAYADARGMWAPDACGEAIDATVRITDIEFDPAGRDWQNKAEEWVALRNEGGAPVAMDGWILRDESSIHRYRFPAGLTLEPNGEVRVRSGCGDDGDEDLYWCADDAVWSNGGDTVVLQTAAGTVVDRVRYPGDY